MEKMIVRYEKAIGKGYWFHYSIGNLDYAVIYPNKTEFMKAKGFKKDEVKFELIKNK